MVCKHYFVKNPESKNRHKINGIQFRVIIVHKNKRQWNTKLVKHCSKYQDIQLVDEIFFNASCLSLVNYEKMSENRQAIIGFFMANLRLREKKKKHCCLSWWIRRTDCQHNNLFAGIKIVTNSWANAFRRSQFRKKMFWQKVLVPSERIKWF